MPPASLDALAASLGATPEHVRTLVERTVARLPRRSYYVFRISGSSGAGRSSPDRPRMIAAFPTPDDALAFAQRNGYGNSPQIRSIGAVDLVARLLSDASIAAIMFVTEHAGEVRRGSFGPSLKVTRADLLEQLQQPASSVPPEPAQSELSAAAYDALQFGIDFKDRAEFRVALAQAVETIVATYEPPVGSVDRGPRSIFATTAVEAWLKEHGFPHARQRQWIDVAGDPMYGGAQELCEIECGTEHHLLVQLLIHQDEAGRQYIKRVHVTA